MKKYLFLIAAILWLGVSFAGAAYQQQGFGQFQEKDGKVSFWCPSSCVVLLGDLGDNDQLNVKGGTRQGDGMWGYGYLVGQNIYTAIMLPAMGYQWTFADDMIHKQLPSGPKQVVFLVTGPLKADDVSLEMGARSAGDAVKWAWNKFRATEDLAPYSINLHYGPSIGSWSWPVFGLVMMLIAVVIAYIVRKKLSLKGGLYAAIVALIVITIVGGVRLLIDDINITIKNVSTFSKDHHDVFDLDDYITVTEKVRAQLKLDDVNERRGKTCTMYAKSHRSWPVDAHWNSVYLRPCTPVQTGSMADYQLYYNIPAEASTSGAAIILTWNNFTLFQTRP